MWMKVGVKFPWWPQVGASTKVRHLHLPAPQFQCNSNEGRGKRVFLRLQDANASKLYVLVKSILPRGVAVIGNVRVERRRSVARWPRRSSAMVGCSVLGLSIRLQKIFNCHLRTAIRVISCRGKERKDLGNGVTTKPLNRSSFQWAVFDVFNPWVSIRNFKENVKNLRVQVAGIHLDFINDQTSGVRGGLEQAPLHNHTIVYLPVGLFPLLW